MQMQNLANVLVRYVKLIMNANNMEINQKKVLIVQEANAAQEKNATIVHYHYLNFAKEGFATQPTNVLRLSLTILLALVEAAANKPNVKHFMIFYLTRLGQIDHYVTEPFVQMITSATILQEAIQMDIVESRPFNKCLNLNVAIKKIAFQVLIAIIRGVME